MDNIYIDTSIFEANNFFEGKRLNELLKLAEEGHISIIMPELTYDEIKNRIKKNITEAINKLNRNRNDVRILRNLPSLESKFEKIDDVKSVEELIKIVDEKFSIAKIKIIQYPTINIKEIFHSYFNKKKPFSAGLKKDEFPDAFALISLEEWCKENSSKCIVFSKDKDLIFYESDNVEYVDYEQYLNDKLEEIEEAKTSKRLKNIARQFDENQHDFIGTITRWLDQQLDDDTKYYKEINYLEVHNLEVVQAQVTLHNHYTITSITDTKIYLQSTATVTYEVDIETDDESTGYYDGEDGVWHYFDTTTVEIENDREIIIDFVYEIPTAGEEFAELEIDEINEGKDLRI